MAKRVNYYEKLTVLDNQGAYATRICFCFVFLFCPLSSGVILGKEWQQHCL